MEDLRAPWKARGDLGRDQTFVSNNLVPNHGATQGDAYRTLWLGVMLASVDGSLDAFTYVGKGVPAPCTKPTPNGAP
jgi:hypothetical protein